ncbi:hypothetical protein [Alteromonas oceanisediminis]|uniref:hypothetical protein n=1 Tax=Alteromonas oceanisediminis TaxID=2836180 RepID=UPI001BDA3CFA|nr:hypothetical protein [Alteromonas oceanisediminis]MBT0587957.1 hypothetical protein [Alteromonas oceanisediminis]
MAGGSNSLTHANVEYDDAILNIKYYANSHLFADTYNPVQRLFFVNGSVSGKKTDFNESRLQLSPGNDGSGWGLTDAGEWASSYLYLADSTGNVFDYLLTTKTFDNLIPQSLNISDFSFGYMDLWVNSENDMRLSGNSIGGDIVDIRSDVAQ